MSLFVFRNQPLKNAFLLYTALSVIFVRLPFWFLCTIIPAWRPRSAWSIRRTLTIWFTQVVVATNYKTGFSLPPFDPEEGKKHVNKPGFTWIEALPNGYLKGEIASIASLNKVESVQRYGYWYGKDLKGRKAHPSEKIIYHLHGGGYVMFSADPTGRFGPLLDDYTKGCSKVVDRTFCLEYRLSSAAPFKPVNPFPTALIDALAGYRYLVETIGANPKNIILSGESSGAHLAFSLARYLVQESIPNLPPPGGLIMHSPSGDWGCTHVSKPNSSMKRNARSDFVGKIFLSGYTARALCGSLPEDSAITNAWISPSSLSVDTRGLFTSFPDTFILSGAVERTLDDQRELRDRLIADNGPDKVKYVEYADASHAAVFTEYQEAEKVQGTKEIADWLSNLYL